VIVILLAVIVILLAVIVIIFIATVISNLFMNSSYQNL